MAHMTASPCLLPQDTPFCPSCPSKPPPHNNAKRN